jgi:NAD(P)H dehydrogenase (quinone)
MNHLIIFAHPNPKSFGKAIEETVIKASETKGFSTKVKDLYKESFNPVLGASDFEAFGSGKIPADIKAEQDLIAWADVISLVYPTWWTGLPAILKGYIDRVFSYGFAYEVKDGAVVGLLKGKKVRLFSTTGTPGAVYDKSGMHNSMKQTQDDGIFRFCGVDDVEHLFFGAVPYVDDSTRKGYLSEAEKKIHAL